MFWEAFMNMISLGRGFALYECCLDVIIVLLIFCVTVAEIF